MYSMAAAFLLAMCHYHPGLMGGWAAFFQELG